MGVDTTLAVHLGARGSQGPWEVVALKQAGWQEPSTLNQGEEDPWALGYNFFFLNPPYPPSGAPRCAHAHMGDVPAMAPMLHHGSTPMHALGQDKQLLLV